MSIALLLDKTATVSPAGGGGGGGVLPSPIPCCVAPADSRTVLEYAQQGISCANVIYSATDLGAQAGDHVTVAGISYPVVAVRSFDNSHFGPQIFVTVCGARI